MSRIAGSDRTRINPDYPPRHAWPEPGSDRIGPFRGHPQSDPPANVERCLRDIQAQAKVAFGDCVCHRVVAMRCADINLGRFGSFSGT